MRASLELFHLHAVIIDRSCGIKYIHLMRRRHCCAPSCVCCSIPDTCCRSKPRLL